MLVKIYRKYLSKSTREKIRTTYFGKFLMFVRNSSAICKSIFVLMFYRFVSHSEKNQLYAFMGKYGLSFYPYPFSLQYKKIPVQIFWDDQLKMPYVIHAGKKLFYPSHTQNIDEGYRFLLMEQDIHSPHRYLEDINRLKGKTILDLGASEGIFSLNAIEIIKHAYLFECDERWVNALNATFAPWKEKVTVVTKYVSDINEENNITIDQFLEGKNKTNLFLKMDIEGYELAALKGAERTIQEEKDIDFSICTYHNEEDAVQITQFFKTHSIETEQTEGLMYFEHDFRKVIIRRKYNKTK